MKIFAAGIGTETNTFSPLSTGTEDFTILRGRDVAAGHVKYPSLDLTQVWGRQAQAHGDTLVFGINAWAQPAGITLRATYEQLRDELLDHLRAALPVDVALLMLHGAMVADGYDDCEEDLIGRVREVVGPQAVIGVELDLHCHLSPSKIARADIVITYKEYPHLDINERAAELFDLARAARLGRIRPTMALFDCRMVGMYPTSRQPLRAFVDSLRELEQSEGVLSASFGHGFQFADVPHMGAKLLVVTNDDRGLAEQLAQQYGLRVHALRGQIGFASFSQPMQAALDSALSSARAPVVVADQSDNTGGGAPGDATFVLRELLERRVENAAAAIFYDPQVVRIARKAIPGATFPVRLGGKLGLASGAPLDMEVTLLAKRDNYVHCLPQQSGPSWAFPVGDAVALHCRGIDVVVGSERCQCLAPSIFSDFGIDPLRKRLLLVKSYQHFHGGFAPIAGEIVYMAAPGAVPPDPRHIEFRRFDTSRAYPWIEDPLAAETGRAC